MHARPKDRTARGDNELANNEKTVANTCIRHVVACMLALPMCVHVREPQGRVSKTAYSHCKHIVMVPKFVIDNWNNQPSNKYTKIYLKLKITCKNKDPVFW